MDQNYTFEKDWKGGFVVKYGRLTTLLCAVTSMFPVLYLWLGEGLIPSGTVILQGWISVASVWAVMYVLEPLTYYPMIGLSGVYLGYLAGNIPYVRVPAMLSATNVIGVGQESAEKYEIVSILGMVASIFVNTGILMLAALLGSYILAVLPPVVLSCFNYALPAIIGSLCATILSKNPKFAVATVLLALIIVLVGVPSGIMFPLSVFGAIGLSVFSYKRKQHGAQSEK